MAQKEGFGFGLGKMKEAFQKAQQIQEGAKILQAELDEMRLTGESGGGLVKVTLSGNQEPHGVEIAPEALNEGAEVLSDLVLAALKDAYTLSTTTMKEKMETLTGGLGLPGGF
ncbi:YbaB/EbfC family nucleoid-associated protein [Tumidithrix helvetica PCC 7403]|uniref:YbaB/EbfC family nucleoid-associated protein n=1 Tax=Tumidithrix helvetica TaxID=3457545 RepID=UPI003CB4BF2F